MITVGDADNPSRHPSGATSVIISMLNGMTAKTFQGIALTEDEALFYQAGLSMLRQEFKVNEMYLLRQEIYQEMLLPPSKKEQIDLINQQIKEFEELKRDLLNDEDGEYG